MKITRTVTRTETVEETVDVLCNQCGKSCLVPISTGDDPVTNPCGLIEATAEGPYGSPLLGDGVTATFSLCEWCLVALFRTFRHPPACFDRVCGDVLEEMPWDRPETNLAYCPTDPRPDPVD